MSEGEEEVDVLLVARQNPNRNYFWMHPMNHYHPHHHLLHHLLLLHLHPWIVDCAFSWRKRKRRRGCKFDRRIDDEAEVEETSGIVHRCETGWGRGKEREGVKGLER